MSWFAKVYIGAVICAGLAGLTASAFLWHSSRPELLAACAFLAIVGSGFKIHLPGVPGTMSVNIIFVFLAVTELGWPETVAVASSSFIAQYLWKVRERPQVTRMLFNVGNAVVSSSAAWVLHRSLVSADIGLQQPLLLAGVSVTYFVINTGAVACVLGLTQSANPLPIWRKCYLWSFPYYLFGASSVWVISALNRLFGWQAWVLIVPMVYALYRLYSLHLEQLEAERRQTEVKAQFLANMSHEIRTPINAVIGMTTLLLNTRQSSEQQEYSRTIFTSANALLSIINDILDFSKIEAGKLDIHPVPASVAASVREALGIIRSEAESKGLALQVDVDPALPGHVKLDAARLRQVLLNLLSNAVKFTHRGSVSLRVILSGPQQLEVRVTDTGIGMPAEAVGMLFQPFTQLDSSNSRSFGGTGLGLSISKKLIDLMGGEIGVESEPGRGSTFWFRLPFEQVGDSELPRQTDVLPVLRPRAAGDGGRVLVVEDNAVNQRVALRLLEKLGYRAEAANNGEEAVERVLRERYSLVLMDCQMPVMDGLEATREIRLRESGRRTPVVALTAGALQSDEDNCRAAGMDGFIPKPIELDRLAQELAYWHGPERHEERSPAVGAQTR